MATVTSSVSGNVTTYVITDLAGNTATVTAQAPGSTVGFSSSGNGILNDGIEVLSSLILQLQTNLRPNVIPGTNSYTN